MRVTRSALLADALAPQGSDELTAKRASHLLVLLSCTAQVSVSADGAEEGWTGVSKCAVIAWPGVQLLLIQE